MDRGKEEWLGAWREGETEREGELDGWIEGGWAGGWVDGESAPKLESMFLPLVPSSALSSTQQNVSQFGLTRSNGSFLY